MRNVPPNLYSIRGLMGCCLFLHDGDNSVMVDSGLVGETIQLRRLFRRLGLAPQALKAVLLTHGHLDHAGNAARIKDWSGARIYAHSQEQGHIDGRYPYQGVNCWCGRLEAMGRAAFAYRPVKIDEFIFDGQILPFWGGLEVMHLPGHTMGHCGFYSAQHNLLFCGDMMASYFFNVHKPPPIYNSAPELLPAAVERIRQLRPRWILPLHFDVLDGDLHRRRFVKLYGLEDWVTDAESRVE